MPLTPKQENFCLAYLESGNASEAYRRAYNAAKMKPETVNRNAKALLDNTKITTRIDELREPAVEAAQMTVEQHLKDLATIRDAAMASDNHGAAVSAEVARGKAAGFYVARSENRNFNHLTHEEALKALA